MTINLPWLLLVLLGSGLGFVYFNHGRKTNRVRFMLFGAALMIVAYFFDSSVILGLVTGALLAGPFIVNRL